jgi:hypothetical protein
MRTKATLSEPSVNALLADTSTALLAGNLAQIEKQLKLIPSSFQTSNLNMKSHTQHINKMYNRKQTFMSISFSINTQRTTQNHEFESNSSINPNICTWVFLHSSLHALSSSASPYVTIHNEGVYISFPSCALKLSNLELNSVYLH